MILEDIIRNIIYLMAITHFYLVWTVPLSVGTSRCCKPPPLITASLSLHSSWLCLPFIWQLLHFLAWGLSLLSKAYFATCSISWKCWGMNASRSSCQSMTNGINIPAPTPLTWDNSEICSVLARRDSQWDWVLATHTGDLRCLHSLLSSAFLLPKQCLRGSLPWKVTFAIRVTSAFFWMNSWDVAFFIHEFVSAAKF